jgi:long-chain fatty acid transport protein
MIVTALLSLSAEASTFYLSDIGAQGLGRAGAFVAGADDITAQWYNPAALTRIKGGMVGLNTAGAHQFIDFQRADSSGPLDEDGNPTASPNQEVSNAASPVFIPHIGVAYGWEKLTLYAGLTTPYAGDFSYPSDGPQRYSLIDTIVIQTFAGPAIAYKATPWLSLGSSLSWNTLKIGQSRQISLYFTNTFLNEDGTDHTKVEDPSADVLFEFEANDTSALSYSLSAMVEPPDGKWAAAVMVQPPIRFDAKGEMSADFSSHFLKNEEGLVYLPQDVAEDDEVTIEVVMPMIIRSGALVRPMEQLELELAFVWEGWSSVETLQIDDLDMDLQVEVFGDVQDQVIEGPIVLPTGYSNSWSLRFGGEWTAQSYAVRAGALFETPGVPTGSLSVNLVDRKKLGYGLGASYNPGGKLSVDVSWFQSFLGTIEVTDSKLARVAAQIDTSDINEPVTTIVEDHIVANGTYRSSILLGAAGFTYRFGQK